MVFTREVQAALKRLNPGLPEDAYSQALRQVVQGDITKTLLQLAVTCWDDKKIRRGHDQREQLGVLLTLVHAILSVGWFVCSLL